MANINSINRTIRICYWNADGIKDKIPELQNFLIDKQIDIMLLQETKLNPNNKLRILNYEVYRRDRVTHRGGVAIISKRNIQHTETEIQKQARSNRNSHHTTLSK